MFIVWVYGVVIIDPFVFPGEPILIPELQMTANVTPIDQVTRYFGNIPVWPFCLRYNEFCNVQ